MRWLPIAEVEALIGKKERNARYWLERHEIPARGERPKLFSERAILAKLAEVGQLHRKVPERPPDVPAETTGNSPEHIGRDAMTSPPRPLGGSGSQVEPIEAAYRVAGEAAAEVALVPLGTMVEELRGLADQLADLARRNEGLAFEVGSLRAQVAGHVSQLTAKDTALAAKDETIAELRYQRDEDREREREALAELRRRAEVAEAELEGARLRLAEVDVPPLVVVAGQDATEAPHVPTTTPAPQQPVQGLWRRLRRRLGGG